MTTKDLSKLTPAELMELAKNPVKKDEKLRGLSPVKEFIVAEDLTTGTTRIPALVVYDRYTHWCKLYGVSRLSMRAFFEEFQHYFERLRNNTGVYYSMNPLGFDLSPEHLKKLTADRRKRNSNGKKKNAKEKERQEENN